MVLTVAITTYSVIGFLVGAVTIWSCLRLDTIPRQPVLRTIYLVLIALDNAILWPITILAAIIDLADKQLQARQAASVRYKIQKFMDEYGDTQRTV